MTAPLTNTCASTATRAQRRRQREQSLLLPKNGSSHIREPNRTMPRLAVYKRRSKLRDMSSSMARQDAECLAHVKTLGGIHDPLIDTFSDDDISAKGGHYRPGMEALLRAIQDGRYDGVVVYEIPRALRNRRESLIFRQIFTDAACELYNVRFPMVSLYGPTAFVFDLLIDMAASEVEATSDRITSWHEFMSKLGAARGPAPWGMTTRASGIFVPGRSGPVRIYTPDEQARDELGGRSRAEIVRQAVADLLAGSSQRAIVGSWNQAGYPPTRATKWTVATLRVMLANPTLAGLAHFKGVLLDETGIQLAPGSDKPPLRIGDPLLDEQTWNRLAAVLVMRSRRPRSSVEHLLRGMVRCGTCGSSMVYQRSEPDRSHNTTSTYRCQRNSLAGPGACATSNSINAGRLESLVRDVVKQMLADPALLADAQAANSPELSARADALRNELTRLNERLRSLEALWLDTTVKDAAAKARFDRHRHATQDQMNRVHSQLAELTVRTERPNLTQLGTEMVDGFEALPPRQQTTVLLELIDRIVVAHAPRTGARWKPERVTIHWATD